MHYVKTEMIESTAPLQEPQKRGTISIGLSYIPLILGDGPT